LAEKKTFIDHCRCRLKLALKAGSGHILLENYFVQLFEQFCDTIKQKEG